jgi:hypothetical protein
MILELLDKAMKGYPAWDTPRARHLLIAIGLQESRLKYREQVIPNRKPGTKGPALGLWQFERGGGVRGVLNHPVSAPAARILVGSQPEHDVWLALEKDDVLAAKFARLLLLTDPRPLPSRSNTQAGWNYYIRNWRPGKPHPETWGKFWRQAGDLVYGPAEAN